MIDSFGNTLDFTTIKAMIFKNLSTIANHSFLLSGDWLVGQGFGSSTIDRSNVFAIMSSDTGWSVVNVTANTLTVQNTNVSDANTYALVLVGVI